MPAPPACIGSRCIATDVDGKVWESWIGWSCTCPLELWEFGHTRSSLPAGSSTSRS
jgi:hypothetical protein